MWKRIYLIKDARWEQSEDHVQYDEYRGITLHRRKVGDKYTKKLKLYDDTIKGYRTQRVDVQVTAATDKIEMIGVI